MSLSARRFLPPAPEPWSRQCSGKVRYRDVSDADRAAMKREREVGRGRLRTYECPACQGWHLAHRRG